MSYHCIKFWINGCLLRECINLSRFGFTSVSFSCHDWLTTYLKSSTGQVCPHSFAQVSVERGASFTCCATENESLRLFFLITSLASGLVRPQASVSLSVQLTGYMVSFFFFKIDLRQTWNDKAVNLVSCTKWSFIQNNNNTNTLCCLSHIESFVCFT